MKLKRFLVATAVTGMMIVVPAATASAHTMVKCPKGQTPVKVTIHGVDHVHCVKL